MPSTSPTTFRAPTHSGPRGPPPTSRSSARANMTGGAMTPSCIRSKCCHSQRIPTRLTRRSWRRRRPGELLRHEPLDQRERDRRPTVPVPEPADIPTGHRTDYDASALALSCSTEQPRGHALDRLLAVGHRRIVGGEDRHRERDSRPLQTADLIDQSLRSR
jgi:hypothetical protein